jgi:hypothetical protein
MKPDFWKRAWPTLAVLAAFLVLAAIYFAPQLQGKTLQQSDMMHVAGMKKEVTDFKANTGETSMWTNSMFGGMPAYQIYAPHTKNLVYDVHDAFLRIFPQPLGIALLYLICFYALGMALGFGPWLSAAMAIGFGFASYNFIILEAGHLTKALAIAYAPLVLAGLLRLFWIKLLVIMRPCRVNHGTVAGLSALKAGQLTVWEGEKPHGLG